MNMEMLVRISPVIGLLGLVFAFVLYWSILRRSAGTERMQEIGKAVREGAMAFLSREYKVLILFVLVVAVLLAVGNKGLIRLVALSFVVGALCSGLAGFFGMCVRRSLTRVPVRPPATPSSRRWASRSRAAPSWGCVWSVWV